MTSDRSATKRLGPLVEVPGKLRVAGNVVLLAPEVLGLVRRAAAPGLVGLGDRVVDVGHGALDVALLADDDDVPVRGLVAGDPDAHLVVLLDVPQFGPRLSDDEPVVPLLDLQLLVHLARVGDLVVVVHYNVVNYLLSLLDVFGLASNCDHGPFRPRPRRPRGFGHRDLHLQCVLDGPNDAALFADEIGQGIGGHLDGVALEVLVRQGSEALGNQLLESLLGLGHRFWLALNAQNVGLHVDVLHVGFFLDHVDGATLGPDHDTDPVFRDLQLGDGELLLGLLLGGRR
mmetsp:Transcript_20069/g.53254  ORF Transcript_20069/g.53254 Transcript_20069/m.53254 type:complete len:287 (+) Transcript_20069:66-926(+)